MFGITLGKKRGKIVAVADIGSGSAAVAILQLRSDGPAAVLAAKRAALPIEERTQEATIAGIGEQLAKAGEDVLKVYAAHMQKGMGPVEELYCVMRAPWSRSKTTHASSRFDQGTIVTDQIIAELVKQALADEKELDQAHFLEASVVRIEINGYPTREPVGKHAAQISVSAVMSDCNPGIRTKVETTLQKIFPHLSSIYRSSTRVFITILGERKDADKNYLIIDIASEGTTLLAVRDGVAVEHLMIPEGMRSILKRISGSGMPEETQTLVRMLARDECSTAACEAVSAAMGHAEPELVRLYGEAMGTCASLRRLPNRLILAAHPDLVPWLSRFFSRIDFSQFTLTMQPFSIETLSTSDLAPWILPENNVVLDSGLALSCALVNIEENRA